ncbi:MAG: hypothetical protein HY530_00460 [Chloroflexi bacterium]|nr:hypothetical protein [Chloroflexota bacterium]
MDSELGRNLLPLIILVLFIVANIFLRRRKAKAPLEIAVGLLSEVKYNQKLVEAIDHRWRGKKMKTGTWEKYKGGLDFLPQPLRDMLAGVFSAAGDFNQQIASARKYKSSSYIMGIDTGRLKEPLAESRRQLEEWVRQNMGRRELWPKRRGLFG